MLHDSFNSIVSQDISACSTYENTEKKESLFKDRWEKASRRLRIELGEDIYSSWFARMELDDIQANTAHLSVPTKFLKSWISSHYIARILSILSAEIPEVTSISVHVRSTQKNHLTRMDVKAPAVPKQPVMAPSPLVSQRSSFSGSEGADLEGLAGSPLDPRFTFSSFLVGTSNKMAHTAALRVAEAKAGEAPLYSPLYIHASVGLGKTHLLQACAHAAQANGRKVIYLTAEKFMYGFVSALKSQSMLAFKEYLRGIDLLIMDDVQFLQGKTVQQEFCHTLNALMDSGRQVVIAADRAHGGLENLDERIRSRLAGGLSLEISTLDEALRVDILKARVAAVQTNQPDFKVLEEVITYVAKAIETNGRDLDGAVNRLLAHTMLLGEPLSLENAGEAIRDLVRTREIKRVKIEDIQKLVSHHYKVTRDDILAERRTANVVRPRQIAMYLSKVLTPRSLPEIGRRFGGRDHTTVLHAVRKIEGLITQNAHLAQEVELLRRMLVE